MKHHGETKEHRLACRCRSLPEALPNVEKAVVSICNTMQKKGSCSILFLVTPFSAYHYRDYLKYPSEWNPTKVSNDVSSAAQVLQSSHLTSRQQCWPLPSAVPLPGFSLSCAFPYHSLSYLHRLTSSPQDSTPDPFLGHKSSLPRLSEIYGLNSFLPL